jgi:hypothetical protein
MRKNVVFQINGGIGKCIAATAVCSAIKKKYPLYDLIVVSGYPEVFLNNPNVTKSLVFGGTSYFYQDYIENNEVEVFLNDPYATTDFVKEEKHLIEIWCELFNLPYNGEFPELFMTQREIESFQRQITNIDKPIFLLQTNGGGDANKKYSWARDLPVSATMRIIEEFKDKYAIFHVKREDQIGYPNTYAVTGNFRFIMAIAMLSQKRLVIDSFMQHALAALRLPAVACWIVNKPKVFGYDLHTHIFANDFTHKPELRNSFLTKFNIAGDELEFPYNNETEIFNVDDIIAALKLGTTNFNTMQQAKVEAAPVASTPVAEPIKTVLDDRFENVEIVEPIQEKLLVKEEKEAVVLENKILSENGENILSE